MLEMIIEKSKVKLKSIKHYKMNAVHNVYFHIIADDFILDDKNKYNVMTTQSCYTLHTNWSGQLHMRQKCYMIVSN